MNNHVKAPSYDELIWPTINALKELGGSASNQELVDKIIEMENFSEEVQQIPHAQGKDTKIEYNSAWARTYLKKFGAVNNSARGVWVLLEKGEKLTEKEALEIPRYVRSLDPSRSKNSSNQEESDFEQSDKIFSPDWKQELLETIKTIDPTDFERLCQLVLRESGFTKVQVTGKSGDGGIDGIGILRVNLLSFHVSFQCKRYQGSVSSGAIRDFRGAMIGRGDKGLFITTGAFTSEARKEANRDGAPAIDLIDGEDFCELLKELSLGISTEMIEKVHVDHSWFKNL